MTQLLKDVMRYDEAKRITGSVKDAFGFLTFPLVASSAGVFPYIQPDGTIRREFKPPEELNDPQSLATLRLAPMTNDHPAIGMITSDNARKYQVGSIGDTIESEEGVRLLVMGKVTDSDTVNDIESGEKTEISPAYRVNLEMTPGIWFNPTTGENMEYDAIQRNIRYNAIAVVKEAREGDDVRIRLNADDARAYTSGGVRQKEMHKGDGQMKFKLLGKEVEVLNADAVGEPSKMKFDGAEYPVHKNVVNAIKAVCDSHDTMEKTHEDMKKNMADMTSHMDEMKGHIEAFKTNSVDKTKLAELQEKLNASEKARKEQEEKANSQAAKDKFNADVKARVELLAVCKNLLPEAQHEKLNSCDTSLEMMKLVVLNAQPEADLKDKSEEYVKGLFTGLAAAPADDKTNGAQRRKIGAAILATEGVRQNDAEVIQAEELSKISDAWKEPSGRTRADARSAGERNAVAGK